MVRTGDLDGDGDLDVIYLSGLDGVVAWVENVDGRGAFTRPPVLVTVVPVVSSPDDVLETSSPSLWVGDLVGHDAALDIAVAAGPAEQVWVFANIDGRGTFNTGAPDRVVQDMPGVLQVSADDMDGDGDQDLVTLSTTDRKIAWTESASHALSPTFVVSQGRDALEYVTTGDVDGDGDVDVLLVASASLFVSHNHLREPGQLAHCVHTARGREQATVCVQCAAGFVLQNNACEPCESLRQTTCLRAACSTYQDECLDHVVAYWPPAAVSATDPGIKSLATADMDKDGDQDVVAIMRAGQTLVWFENQHGSFAAEHSIYHASAFIIDADPQLVLADLDGDGDVDVLAPVGVQLQWYENINGTFPEHGWHTVLTVMPTLLHVADIDGDKDLDIVLALGDRLAWMDNADGRGQFRQDQMHTIASEAPQPSALFAADLDDDGDGDLVVALDANDMVGWYENVGGSSFPVFHAISQAMARPASLLVLDVDGDGDRDIVAGAVGDRLGPKLMWFENADGNGSFPEAGHRALLSTLDRVPAIHAADIDGDGDRDLLVALPASGQVLWLENAGRGRFADGRRHRVVLGGDQALDAVAAADVDGDGDLDVLSASSANDGQITWHRNEVDIISPPNAIRGCPEATLAAYTDANQSFATINLQYISAAPLLGHVPVRLAFFNATPGSTAPCASCSLHVEGNHTLRLPFNLSSVVFGTSSTYKGVDYPLSCHFDVRVYDDERPTVTRCPSPQFRIVPAEAPALLPRDLALVARGRGFDAVHLAHEWYQALVFQPADATTLSPGPALAHVVAYERAAPLAAGRHWMEYVVQDSSGNTNSGNESSPAHRCFFELGIGVAALPLQTVVEEEEEEEKKEEDKRRRKKKKEEEKEEEERKRD